MDADWSHTLAAYTSAAQWFEGIASAGHERWDLPALGEWTVRDLTGHTTRALLTVETYLARPATVVDVPTPAEYFDRALSAVGDPAAVAQRGRDAGAALGDHPETEVVTIVGRVLGLLEEASPDALLTTPVGGMRLLDYLPTRTFELTVHGLDLTRALGLPEEAPEAAVHVSLSVLGDLAIAQGRGEPILLAATGRGPLPEGFTLL